MMTKHRVGYHPRLGHVDVTVHGPWTRVVQLRTGKTGYYWHRIRVPWIAWAMFS